MGINRSFIVIIFLLSQFLHAQEMQNPNASSVKNVMSKASVLNIGISEQIARDVLNEYYRLEEHTFSAMMNTYYFFNVALENDPMLDQSTKTWLKKRNKAHQHGWYGYNFEFKDGDRSMAVGRSGYKGYDIVLISYKHGFQQEIIGNISALKESKILPASVDAFARFFKPSPVELKKRALISWACMWLENQHGSLEEGQEILSLLKNREVIPNKLELIWRTTTEKYGNIFKRVYDIVQEKNKQI